MRKPPEKEISDRLLCDRSGWQDKGKMDLGAVLPLDTTKRLP